MPQHPTPAVDSGLHHRLTIGIVATDVDLWALRVEWTELLNSSRADTIFLTWEWASTWWKVYRAGTLHVIVVRNEDGELVGLAPLHLVSRRIPGIKTWQAAVFLGYGRDVTPEYLDFIVRTGWEPSVVPAILNHLLQDGRIAELDLQPFAAHSSCLATTLSTLRSAGGITRHRPSSQCPIAVLPSTREEFMAKRSKNYRKKLSEYERRCRGRLAPRLRWSTTPDQVSEDLRKLQQLHAARWGDEARAFRSTEYITFHDQFAQLMLEQNYLRLFSFESDRVSLAMSYCFNYHDRYYYYQAGRDPSLEAERPGLVLMHLVVQQAIAEGASVFDFLSGQEAYKSRWATGAASSDRVRYWREPLSLVAAVYHRALQTVVSLPQRSSRWKASSA